MAHTLEIKKSLLKIHPFSEQHLNIFASQLTLKKIKKKAFLVNQNQICDDISFIIDGSFRLYTQTEHSELTIKFFTENNWVAEMESLLLQQPSKHCIEALENSYIATISLKDIHVLMHKYPCFIMLNALIAELTISTNQIVALNSKNPDERYKELLSKNPDWINRFPQMQIASYLGIAPETLSRVRARIF